MSPLCSSVVEAAESHSRSSQFAACAGKGHRVNVAVSSYVEPVFGFLTPLDRGSISCFFVFFYLFCYPSWALPWFYVSSKISNWLFHSTTRKKDVFSCTGKSPSYHCAFIRDRLFCPDLGSPVYSYWGSELTNQNTPGRASCVFLYP